LGFVVSASLNDRFPAVPHFQIREVSTMAAFDTVIRHGTVVTASETFKADVAIKDGRIVSLGESLTDANDMIDATDMLVLPGGIGWLEKVR
jgi:adenine deaminase